MFRLSRPEQNPEQLLLFNANETAAPRKTATREMRRLMAPRDDLRPAYLNTQGLRVGKSGAVLQVKEKDVLVQEIRINEICQLNLQGNIQISTQAIQALCEADIPLFLLLYGRLVLRDTTGLCTKNVFLRQQQFACATEPWFCKRLARDLVAGKIRNQRTFLLRNHIEPPENALRELKAMAVRADECESIETLLGLEGNAARLAANLQPFQTFRDHKIAASLKLF